MDLRSGIIETASDVGISPLDLATAISYETGGTFDPRQKGPITQWGQHEGFIQFGEPQAREYGVDWNDPVGSQLGANKAISKYLKKAGVKPGMGLLDIYSAINAGGVGLYNRSDANNGGAPGTVADKVNKQMAGHRKKAADLLGGTYSGSTHSGGGHAAPSYEQEEYTHGNYAQATPEQGQGANALSAPAPRQEIAAMNPMAVAYQMPTTQAQPGGFDTNTNPFLSYLRGA